MLAFKGVVLREEESGGGGWFTSTSLGLASEAGRVVERFRLRIHPVAALRRDNFKGKVQREAAEAELIKEMLLRFPKTGNCSALTAAD